MTDIIDHTHFTERTGWLRAAVLGANDGLISTSSIIIGVAAAANSTSQILVAGTAGLVAGAMSMAAGEYVSVSSQADTEKADLKRETSALAANPQGELTELISLFVARGMTEQTARIAALEMTSFDALATHAREDIGISDALSARPFQAAIASAVAFLAGGLPPVLIALIAAEQALSWAVVGVALSMLLALGAIGARLGGAAVAPAALRVAFWGIVAMGITHLIGIQIGVWF